MTEPEEPEDSSPDASGHPLRAGVKRRVDQGLFLEAFAVTGNLTAAAQRSEVHRQRHYEWMTDPKYAADFKDAEGRYLERLESEADRRAREGWDEPVFQGGREVGTIRKHSDALLMFLMKGANPSKYRENAKPLDAEGGNTQGDDMTWDEKRDLRAAIARAKEGEGDSGAG